MRNRPVEAIPSGLGGKVAGKEVRHGEHHDEAVPKDAAREQMEGAKHDPDGEQQMNGVEAIVEIGEQEAGEYEEDALFADAQFDEKNLVEETNQVG